MSGELLRSCPHSPISSVGQSAVLILCISRNFNVSSATLMSPVRARYGTGQSQSDWTFSSAYNKWLSTRFVSGLQGTLASKSMRLNLLITSQSLARMTRFLNLFVTSFQNTLMMFINFCLGEPSATT